MFKRKNVILTKDIDTSLFYRFSGTIPDDVISNKILNILMPEHSLATAGFSITDKRITAFYIKHGNETSVIVTIIYTS
ncbi:hypothetical protein [Fusobacterium ulcerans]|uniref:hypothetical protein n=1 Tax=Fusobacterium ulcerans TaxID=861 RepID=UPI0030ABBBE5